MNKFHNYENPMELVDFLEEVLIPDLRESGSNASADDFEDCAEHIKRLLSPPVEDLNFGLGVSDRPEDWDAADLADH